MKQSPYLIFGIVAVLIIIGIIVIINPFSNQPQNGVEDLEGKRAIFDTTTIEATVLSVSLRRGERPDDMGQIRIDSISNYIRNPEDGYEPLPLSMIGTEVTVNFAYSARPTKIRCRPGSAPPVEMILPDPRINVTQSNPFEDGYFIIHYYTDNYTDNCPEEIILPGISEGDKIRSSISYYPGRSLNIGKYEIIP